MSEIKKRAKYLLVTEKGKLRREKLFIGAISTGIFISRAVFTASVFAQEVYFFGFSLSLSVFLIPSAAAFFILLYFYFSHRLFFAARLFYLSDPGFDIPYRFMRLSFVLRYAVFLAVKAAVKLLWLSFFLFPSGFVIAVIVRVFIVAGNMQRVMFISLLTAAVLLFFTGILFFLRVSGRYMMSELLFLRNPRQSPFMLLKNSAGFTGDRFSGKQVLRAYSCLLRGRLYGKMLFTLFMTDIFFEREYYRNFGIFQPRRLSAD